MRWTSGQVRDTFLQYFLRHSSFPHVHVPSSSIIPRNDPTLAFVNAGMNQFKDAILGMWRPPNVRVANSQKCLRINDLSLVGVDTYHHTFFEMLGNWSFANYFKEDACQMAWDLLTNVYKLDPQRLYVTYYAGSSSIPRDEKTKEIWESIGLPKDRILPFVSENFWSMGPMGPCGPSTEIHYDHRGVQTDCSEVNKSSGTVVEVWNLVFMQYNRTEQGSLEPLPLSHVVDTGAGLERLTAVLNGEVSNYNTDLFSPVFTRMQQIFDVPGYTGSFSQDAQLDCGYRLLGDHLRAITVALSDGILPQTNHKIRKLIQRVFTTIEKHFLHSSPPTPQQFVKCIDELVKEVSQTLSPVYPEISKMTSQISEILFSEAERYVSVTRMPVKGNEIIPQLLLADFPSLSRIKQSNLEKVLNLGRLEGSLAFKWYDSLGVSKEAAEELCHHLNIEFDEVGMNQEMAATKSRFKNERSKQLLNADVDFIRRVESFLSKYNPEVSGSISEPSLTAKDGFIQIEWIFDDVGNPLDKTTGTSWIILDKTPFIPGSKSLMSDTGSLISEDGSKLAVEEVKTLPSGWILHKISNGDHAKAVPKTKIRGFQRDNAKLFGREISANTFFGLQHWLHKHFRVARITDGFISDREIQVTLTLLKGDIGAQEIGQMEEELNSFGYPLVVTKRKLRKNGEYELTCATGLIAENVRRNGSEALDLVEELTDLCQTTETPTPDSIEEIRQLSTELTRCIEDSSIQFPFVVCQAIKEITEKAGKVLEKIAGSSDLNKMVVELSQTQDPVVVKAFQSENEFSSIQKLSRAVQEKPSVILTYSSDGFVQGRCAVPEAFNANLGLSAKEWLEDAMVDIKDTSIKPPKGQNSSLVVNLKRMKISNAGEKVNSIISRAQTFVDPFLKRDTQKTSASFKE